ncbi:hypothetical protein GGI06_002877 [Coemansia sp. S85]|nr:hypothetical protein GGI06_002877 [Coemansia sp. S85]
MGFGLGLNIQILLIVVQTAAPTEEMASATTLFLFMRILGSSIGVAAMQSIFQNSLLPKLTRLVAEHPEFTAAIMGSVNDQSLIYKSGIPLDTRNELVHIYVLALKKVFIATVPFAGVAFLLTLPLKHVPLRANFKPGAVGE